jgi:cytochrome c-type biogenesis protein CcmH/NrfF
MRMRNAECGMRNELRSRRADHSPDLRSGRGQAWVGILAFLLTMALAGTVPVEAQSRVVPGKSSTVGTLETESVARAAMFQLRSPVTPSHTLDMCPNVGVEALRDTIRMAAAEGQSVDQIVEGVIARYGEHLRLVPERRGAGLWAWIMPPIALLFGAGLLMARLRKLRGPSGGAPAPVGAGLSDEERERLDAALAELEVSQEEPA